MVKEFKFPDVGEGITEGTLLKWLVKKGDSVKEDQNIAEVETDKSVVEIPSPFTGIVEELKVKEDTLINVGDVIMTFAKSGDDKGSSNSETKVEATDSNSSFEKTESKSDDGSISAKKNEELAEKSENSARKVAAKEIIASPTVKKEALEKGINLSDLKGSGQGGKILSEDLKTSVASASDIHESNGNQGNGKSLDGLKGGNNNSTNNVDSTIVSNSVLALPGVRALAKEKGIPLEDISPTGARGQITEDDVKNAFEVNQKSTSTSENSSENNDVIQSSKATMQSASGANDSSLKEELDADSKTSNSDELNAKSASQIDDAKDVFEKDDKKSLDEKDNAFTPMSPMRKAIAKNMMASVQSTAPVTIFEDFDMTEVDEFIARSKENGIKISYLSIFIKTLTVCLREFPDLASQIKENNLVYNNSVNIGFAVDTEKGLLVPVIHDVKSKSIRNIASSIKDLALIARDGKLSKDKMSGGSFTVSSLGGIGGKYFTPIINYPEVAILGIGHARVMPVYEGDNVLKKNICPISLTFDHRAVDGAMAARFIMSLKKYIENIEYLFMEMS